MCTCAMWEFFMKDKRGSGRENEKNEREPRWGVREFFRDLCIIQR